jgi:hypothetical protein
MLELMRVKQKEHLFDQAAITAARFRFVRRGRQAEWATFFDLLSERF